MAKYDKSPELMEKISFLPTTPGVYTYYDAEGHIIYVGKAKNLKRRVSSYFNRTHDCLRTNLLVRAIADMSYIVVPTEQDALNLENSMIKEHQPRYNVLLKDDKSYPWIVVTNELFPRVFLTRQHIKDGSRYYGPYTNTAVAKTVLNLIADLYPVRTCALSITPDYLKRGKGRLCLKYHIKKCRGCCTGLIGPEEYGVYIERIKQILRGETGELLRHLESEMQSLAEQLRFEEAQELKDQYDLLQNYRSRSVIVSQSIDELDVFGIDDADRDVYINYMHVRRGAVVRSVTLRYKRPARPRARRGGGRGASFWPTPSTRYAHRWASSTTKWSLPSPPKSRCRASPSRCLGAATKPSCLKSRSRTPARHALTTCATSRSIIPKSARGGGSNTCHAAVERMQADFRLPELPRHIECFDNSNIQGTNPVASCVVFRDGKPSKKDYRHFKIQSVTGPDDFASMKEVLTRRYTRLMQEGEELPQLIVVDGGKGQLSAAVEALDEIGLRGRISVVGIAKRLEEIYFPGDSLPLYVDKTSESLRVIQHLRDEAHRFGITFHRDLRSKGQISSELDNIKGIGPKTAATLLRHFRSVKRLREAPVQEIASIVGPAKAALVKAGLGKQQ